MPALLMYIFVTLMKMTNSIMCKNTCCFFGHRHINETEELRARIVLEIENMIVNAEEIMQINSLENEVLDSNKPLIICL